MRTSIIGVATLAALAGCARQASVSSPAGGMTMSMGGATAAMRDSTGKELGTLTVSDAQGGIMVMGSLKGLPAGVHAIHLHTVGSCSPNFAAAGGHWNPTNMQHGKDAPGGPHLGDTPNITVAADGSFNGMVTSPGGTLRGTNALLDADGAAVVIHALPDDYKSQPAGAAGARIACGVVR